MATYHIIYVATKVKNRKKNEQYYAFSKCENARQLMYVDRMAGKVKDFVLANSIDNYSAGRDYNGYGYSTWVHGYLLTPAKGRKLQTLVEGKKVEKKKEKAQEDIITAWAKRLDKLTGCGVEVAIKIAKEKLAYKNGQIAALNDRQVKDGYSKRRQSLINQISRANPLRWIKNADHAQAVLTASHRHNSTCYEVALEHYRDEAKWGNIEHEDVRSLARVAARKWV